MNKLTTEIELSIIIANYNNSQYLADCFESILKQTYTDFEIIISDDLSTDNSKEIILKYSKKHPQIKAHFNKNNQGVSKNRHIAINLAQGKYITTLDSDDVYWNKSKLETEMKLIKEYEEKYNKPICAFSNIAILDPDLNYIRDQFTQDQLKEGYILNHIITRAAHIPRDFIMKKEDYFQAGGFDFSLNAYEDWDLKIRIAKFREFYYTGVYGTGYRRRSGGLSDFPTQKHYKILKRLFNKNIHLVAAADKFEVKQKFSEFLNIRKDKIIKQLEKPLNDPQNH